MNEEKTLLDKLAETEKRSGDLMKVAATPGLARPSIGRIVTYKLGVYDGDPGVVNNGSLECPAVIVRVWSDTCVNLRLLFDGAGELPWKTSVLCGDDVGQWRWPMFVPPKIGEATHR